MPVYKDEKRKTWYAAFYYTDWTGVRRKKKKEGFPTRREAQEFERGFVEKEGGGSDMSFGSLTEIYMKDCSIRLRETTYSTKKHIIDTKILPLFKDFRICDITPATVRHWQNMLMSDKEEYAPTYLKTINNQLSAILNYAVRYYGLPFNPAARCGSMGKKNAETMQFWTVDEYNSFMKVVSGKPASVAIFATLFWTGMREGELLALTLNDVDFAAKKIYITKSLARVNGEDVIQPPKTEKSKRDVTVPVFLLAILKDYASRLYDYEPGERLFAYSKRYIQWELLRGCPLAGVKKIRVHDLRHSHAALLIELGFPILLVSERLGHENIETTLNTYGHLYPNKHVEVAQRLEDLGGATSARTDEEVAETMEKLENFGK